MNVEARQGVGRAVFVCEAEVTVEESFSGVECYANLITDVLLKVWFLGGLASEKSPPDQQPCRMPMAHETKVAWEEFLLRPITPTAKTAARKSPNFVYMTRRNFLQWLGLMGLSSIGFPRRHRSSWIPPILDSGRTYPFELPNLPYPYEALEPHIDTQTMKVHHQGHHAAYVNNLNKALADLPAFQGYTLEALLSNLPQIPEPQRTMVRNHGGGHWNHSFFWPLLTPKPQEPSPALQKQITNRFGSWAAFRGQFLDAGARLFGSGWVWLILTQKGELEITTTPNQDNPLMPVAPLPGKPILGIDVWEHAYYLKYQNRRTEYLAAVWNIISWSQVEANLG